MVGVGVRLGVAVTQGATADKYAAPLPLSVTVYTSPL